MERIVIKESEVLAYREFNAVNQSSLKTLLTSIEEFHTPKDLSDKENIIIGDGVDILLTSSEEVFNQKYYVSNSETKPSEAIEQIIKEVVLVLSKRYELMSKNYLMHNNDELFDAKLNSGELTFAEYVGEINKHEDLILAICDQYSYQKRYGADAKLKAVIEPGKNLFYDLVLSEGKKVITAQQHLTIINIVNSFKTNPRTKHFFDDSKGASMVIHQLPIYFKYREVTCKCLLDMVFVYKDENGKVTDVFPVDIKTMEGNTINFVNNLKKFRYDIQAAFYTEGLKEYFTNGDGSCPTIHNFKFVVESTTKQGKPLVYTVSDELLNIGKFGRKTVYGGEFNPEIPNYIIVPGIKGFDSLISTYLFHEENGWEEEKIIKLAENENHELVLGWGGIEIPSKH